MGFTYAEMLDLLSFAILIDIPSEKLVDILSNKEFDDGLILWLKLYIKEKTLSKINSELIYPELYSKYKKIINF